MSFLIVTGMSGAGKSTALKMLEDAGYFCADNLPMPLVDKFARLAAGVAPDYAGVALGIDVRTVKDREAAGLLLQQLQRESIAYQILYLDANDNTLIRRFKETRRKHPLTRGDRIEEGIKKERQIVEPFRAQCDYLIDTTSLKTLELRQELDRILEGENVSRKLYVTVLSFGFKHGIPEDADLVFDVRFLPNPYYIPDLKEKTGKEQAVCAYVRGGGLADQFEEKWFDMIDFLLPNYIAEGKTQLVIAVGCTGGKHRSVCMAQSLASHLDKQDAYRVSIQHRDILH